MLGEFKGRVDELSENFNKEIQNITMEKKHEKESGRIEEYSN